jgi:hypothetical protein
MWITNYSGGIRLVGCYCHVQVNVIKQHRSYAIARGCLNKFQSIIQLANNLIVIQMAIVDMSMPITHRQPKSILIGNLIRKFIIDKCQSQSASNQ